MRACHRAGLRNTSIACCSVHRIGETADATHDRHRAVAVPIQLVSPPGSTPLRMPCRSRVRLPAIIDVTSCQMRTEPAEQGEALQVVAPFAAYWRVPADSPTAVDGHGPKGRAKHCSMRSRCVGEGCWEWRFSWPEVGPQPADRLAALARTYGRIAL